MNAIAMRRELRYSAVALSVVVFWSVAAAFVVAADQSLSRLSLAGSLAVKIAAIVLAALAFMRIVGHNGAIDQALFVGIAWTLMSMISEVIVVTRFNRSWCALLGSPDHGAARDILLVTWVLAPVLFAKRRS